VNLCHKSSLYSRHSRRGTPDSRHFFLPTTPDTTPTYPAPAEAEAEEWGYKDEEAREARGPQEAPQDPPPCSQQYLDMMTPKGIVTMSPKEYKERTEPARYPRCDGIRKANAKTSEIPLKVRTLADIELICAQTHNPPTRSE